MISDPRNTNTTALFLALSTGRSGDSIFVLPDGSVETLDAGLSHRSVPDNWLFIDRASGEFDYVGWGISRDRQGWFEVEGLPGVFDTDTEALQAAVNEFGITAEIHDAMIDQVAERLTEAQRELSALES